MQMEDKGDGVTRESHVRGAREEAKAFLALNEKFAAQLRKPSGFQVNEDGTIDAGVVALSYQGLERIPVPFSKVDSFNCSANGLTSLENSPREVKGDFACYANRLRSLAGAPVKVQGGFNCSQNRLEGLEGAPVSVGGSFQCWGNRLRNLRGAPREVGGDFDCSCNDLVSLEGEPDRVDGFFVCVGSKGLPTFERERIVKKFGKSKVRFK